MYLSLCFLFIIVFFYVKNPVITDSLKLFKSKFERFLHFLKGLKKNI